MQFEIQDNGAWINPSLYGHHYDRRLCLAISEFLKSEKMVSVFDFGCGPGYYVHELLNEQFDIVGYDGNPYTEKLSKELINNHGAVCHQMDLSKQVDLRRTVDCVLSLEVGEHIPAEYENTFLDNLSRHAKKCIILSWAIEGQPGDGHVNCRNNNYIIEQMSTRSFTYFEECTLFLREFTTLPWFKNTIMVFWSVKYLNP